MVSYMGFTFTHNFTGLSGIERVGHNGHEANVEFHSGGMTRPGRPRSSVVRSLTPLVGNLICSLEYGWHIAIFVNLLNLVYNDYRWIERRFYLHFQAKKKSHSLSSANTSFPVIVVYALTAGRRLFKPL